MKNGWGLDLPTADAPRPHAPLTAGARSYSYDENGNTLSHGTWSYGWDGSNRLVSIGGVSFTYAPDGSRLKKSKPAGTTPYLGSDIERAPPFEKLRRDLDQLHLRRMR